jgi:hypothetical protein
MPSSAMALATTRLTGGASTPVPPITTGRREFFTELDSSIRGSVKFGDASGVEIKGVVSVIFTAKAG